MSPEKLTLDDVVRESREILDPSLAGKRVDWESIDEKLFARVASEARAQGAIAKLEGRRGWATAAAALAFAAAVPFMLGRSSTTPLEDALGHESRADRSAGALAWKEGAGDVWIGAAQIAASAGSALERGDAVETHDARAYFERAAHGKNAVTWALEDASRVTVKGTRGALVLALERGSVEAQVTPVANGEAFAVDVDRARVAVHGTHLRVSRDGTRVIVDLTEGVVSIGVPPRSGSTYGELVTAPAHIEFDADDPRGTLKVTHSADRVRTALAMHPAPELLATATPRMQIPPEPPHAQSGAPSSPSPASMHGASASASTAKPDAPAAPLAEVPAVVLPAAVSAHPEEMIVAAVRECARANASAHPDDVVITVTSTLELRVGPSGAVESARFVPPLNPEVQTCAATSIYQAHFVRPGGISIPLDFKR
jgi:hypothetical protein